MKKILIIENDIDTLEIVRIVLDENGYDVFTSDAKMPIGAIIEINPNLIVIDYLLGNGFGDELCLEIKSNPHTEHIPVILFSASHNLSQIAHDSCADAYINKPFDLMDFVEQVGELAL